MKKLSPALSITWLPSVIFTRLMHCAQSLHCCANKTLIMMRRLTCARPEDESSGFSVRKEGACLSVAALQGPRTAEAHFKGSGEGSALQG